MEQVQRFAFLVMVYNVFLRFTCTCNDDDTVLVCLSEREFYS